MLHADNTGLGHTLLVPLAKGLAGVVGKGRQQIEGLIRLEAGESLEVGGSD